MGDVKSNARIWDIIRPKSSRCCSTPNNTSGLVHAKKKKKKKTLRYLYVSQLRNSADVECCAVFSFVPVRYRVGLGLILPDPFVMMCCCSKDEPGTTEPSTCLCTARPHATVPTGASGPENRLFRPHDREENHKYKYVGHFHKKLPVQSCAAGSPVTGLPLTRLNPETDVECLCVSHHCH